MWRLRYHTLSNSEVFNNPNFAMENTVFLYKPGAGDYAALRWKTKVYITRLHFIENKVFHFTRKPLTLTRFFPQKRILLYAQ